MRADKLHKTILRGRIREFVVFICVLAIVTAGYRVVYRNHALFVVISSQSGHAVSDVSIHFQGGPILVGTIKNMVQQKRRVSVASDSGIGIQYTELGNNVTIAEFGYVERGYRGEMQFTLKPHGTHDVHDAVEPFI